MNFKWDLKKEFVDKKKEISKKAQLRKRSLDSIARPRAKENIINPKLKGI